MLAYFKSLFITLESTAEGLGKTTQAKLLSERLQEDGYETVLTYEPLQPAIRELLKNKDVDLSQEAEILLFFADRANHVHKLILPALEEGKIVICDRYVDSSYAYQGFGRGYNMRRLRDLFMIATGGLYPDITFLLDGLPFRSMDATDRFESQEQEFFKRVRTGLLHMAVENPERFFLLNVNADLAVTSEKIYQRVKKQIYTS